MSYKTTVALSCANRAAALTELWSQLTAMGWTLHDNQDGSSYRVYYSNGEASDKLKGYVKISWVTANTISCNIYYYWDNVTHTGYGTNGQTATVTTSESGFYLWIHGDKNYVWINTKVSTTYYRFGFGYCNKRIWTLETDLTVAASSGASVTLTVTSTAGFVAGEYYQIVGASGEGRDKVQVASITNINNMVITTLPRNYGIGSRIGQCPLLFCCSYMNGTGIGTKGIASMPAVGTTDYSPSGVDLRPLIDSGFIDPDVRGQSQYVLVPYIYPEMGTGTNDSFAGYFGENWFFCAITGLNNEDTFEVTRCIYSQATGGTANTLVDSGEAWTPDAWIGKVVIITAGTGAGQIRKISDNDATSITVDTNWVTNPDATSFYVICDEAYRAFIGSYLAVREGF